MNITYTDFKKIKTLTEGNKHYILTYGIDDQRRKSEYKINGITQKTKYYLGDYEEETDNLGNIKKIHYLSGGAILINTNGVETLYYGYADYQGNLLALTNESGTVVERYAYDPWGKRRNPADWTQDDIRTSWIVSRGYTMHEHLDAFGIINMNGRVYDPLTAMFFSPDPFVQAPGNWLNYNRYSYCINNPFKYTDPSGELFGVDDAIVMLAMMYMGGVQANFFTADNPMNPADWNWSSGKTYVGIASGLIPLGTQAIGGIFGHELGSFGNELLRGGAHGIFGGLLSLAEGGDFWEGFAVGVASSLVGSGMEAVGMGSDYLPLVMGIAGAGTAALMGGNPINGFMQGYGIGAYNHKGERLLLDDGTFAIASIDDAVIIGNRLSFFPLPFYTNSFTKGYAQFGSRRSGGQRSHAGVDLYAPVGTNVSSITSGEILRVSEFYRGSFAIEIDHYSYIGRYTEIKPISGLKVGDSVKPGQTIGTIKNLKLDDSMLHFEMYSGTATGPLTNTANPPYMRRSDLLNPTNFLLKLRIK